MTPEQELEYLQRLVGTAITIATLMDGNVPEALASLVSDKIADLCPETS